VFRYPETRSATCALVGALAGLGVGIAMLSPAVMGAGCGAGAVGGIVVGRRMRYYRCASCGDFCTPELAQCRECGGSLVGEIRHARDRLDAEDAWERQHGQAVTHTED
jgi:hypothetical protein